MNTRFLVPTVFLGLFAASAIHQFQSRGDGALDDQAEAIVRLAAENPPAETGSFPNRWIFGGDCANDPLVQVHAYNEDTYILRQSKCETFESPFLYLLFGEDTALLLDTGANSATPIQAVVQGVIEDWLARNGKTTIDLVVQHTHGHFDHFQADSQFIGAPYVTAIESFAAGAYEQSWGFQDYPNDVPTYDLGGRVLDVIGTPGHAPQSVSLYDRETQLLLTGDIVYPGHLFIFGQTFWPDFRASLGRLASWASTHPVSWVLGCHVEMSNQPFTPYAYGTTVQPDEHPLQLEPLILNQVFRAARLMGNDPVCQIFEQFVIHPVHKCGITWNG